MEEDENKKASAVRATTPVTQADLDARDARQEQQRRAEGRSLALAGQDREVALALAAVPADLRPGYADFMAMRLIRLTGADDLGARPATAEQVQAAFAEALAFRPLPANTKSPEARAAGPTAAEAARAATGPAGGPGGVSQVPPKRMSAAEYAALSEEDRRAIQLGIMEQARQQRLAASATVLA